MFEGSPQVVVLMKVGGWKGKEQGVGGGDERRRRRNGLSKRKKH